MGDFPYNKPMNAARPDLTSNPAPNPAARRVISGVEYVVTQVELMPDYKAPGHIDQVIRAKVARVDGITVTRHTVYVGVAFERKSAGLVQDRDQPHARDLVATVMTGYNWGHMTGR